MVFGRIVLLTVLFNFFVPIKFFVLNTSKCLRTSSPSRLMMNRTSKTNYFKKLEKNTKMFEQKFPDTSFLEKGLSVPF